MVENYSIKSRSHRCHVTEEAFQEDQPFIAAIFPDPEASGYIRLDYSTDAWDTREDKDNAQPFSFWRSHYKPPVKEEKTQVTPHDPYTLFSKLIEDDEAHTENARFILAAMLERKKIIRETDTQQLPTGLLRIYENRKTGDVFIVKDPQIALADVESIQEEVQQLLDPDKYLPQEAIVPSTEESQAANRECAPDSPPSDMLPETLPETSSMQDDKKPSGAPIISDQRTESLS